MGTQLNCVPKETAGNKLADFLPFLLFNHEDFGTPVEPAGFGFLVKGEAVSGFDPAAHITFTRCCQGDASGHEGFE